VGCLEIRRSDTAPDVIYRPPEDRTMHFRGQAEVTHG
jgi:hypothetical protein